MKINKTQLERAIELIEEVNYDCKEPNYTPNTRRATLKHDVGLLGEAIEILNNERRLLNDQT